MDPTRKRESALPCSIRCGHLTNFGIWYASEEVVKARYLVEELKTLAT